MAAKIENAFDLLVGAENTLNAKKKKNKKGGQQAQQQAQQQPQQQAASASKPAADAALPSGGPLELADAVAILERAARDAKSTADKCKLWKEWIRQVRGLVWAGDLRSCLVPNLLPLTPTGLGQVWQEPLHQQGRRNRLQDCECIGPITPRISPISTSR